MVTLTCYREHSGAAPFELWFNHLDFRSAAKVTAALTRIEDGRLSHVRKIGVNLFAFELNCGLDYVIYYGLKGNIGVLLGACKTQLADTTPSEILNRWAEWFDQSTE